MNFKTQKGDCYMKEYLTINEFAKLRNVNANSLRYYEKLGILIPALTDPQTKYRYYLPEQLVLLDTITLCIKLGIPLKNLKDYIDDNGSLNEKRIFEDGRQIMQKKISDMQSGLNLVQFNLKLLEQNQQYSDKKGIYTREIEERFLITRPFCGDWENLIQKERAAMELFFDAQEQNMAPVFPAGILIDFESASISFSFFFQVLQPWVNDKHMVHLPKAAFRCMQADLTSETDILELLNQNFSMKEVKTVIISNMLLNKLHFDSRRTEIQVFDRSPFLFPK